MNGEDGRSTAATAVSHLGDPRVQMAGIVAVATPFGSFAGAVGEPMWW